MLKYLKSGSDVSFYIGTQQDISSMLNENEITKSVFHIFRDIYTWPKHFFYFPLTIDREYTTIKKVTRNETIMIPIGPTKIRFSTLNLWICTK